MKLSDLKYITQQDIDESHINITSADMYRECREYNSHALAMRRRKWRFLRDFYGMMLVDLILLPFLTILTGKYTLPMAPITDPAMSVISLVFIAAFMVMYVIVVAVKRNYNWLICLGYSLLILFFRNWWWMYIVSGGFIALNCFLVRAIKKEDDLLKEQPGYPGFAELVPSFIRDGKEFDGLDEMMKFEDSEESDDLVHKEDAPPVNPFDKYRIKPEEDQGLLRDTDINT